MTPNDILGRLDLYRPHPYGFRSRFPRCLRDPARAPDMNCCVFVESLVIGAAGIEWSEDQHRRMMIQDGTAPFSPVEALVDAGLAHEFLHHGCPPAWSVVQGWGQLRPPRRGHTFIVVRQSVERRVLILEANDSFGVDGVGWRGIGNVRDVGTAIPDRWWELTEWTWAKVRRRFPHRAACTLRLSPGGVV